MKKFFYALILTGSLVFAFNAAQAMQTSAGDQETPIDKASDLELAKLLQEIQKVQKERTKIELELLKADISGMKKELAEKNKDTKKDKKDKKEKEDLVDKVYGASSSFMEMGSSACKETYKTAVFFKDLFLILLTYRIFNLTGFTLSDLVGGTFSMGSSALRGIILGGNPFAGKSQASTTGSSWFSQTPKISPECAFLSSQTGHHAKLMMQEYGCAR